MNHERGKFFGVENEEHAYKANMRRFYGLSSAGSVKSVVAPPIKQWNLVDKKEAFNYEPGRALMDQTKQSKRFNKTGAMKETYMLPQDRVQGEYIYDILTGSYRNRA